MEDAGGVTVDFVDDAGAVLFFDEYAATGGFGVFNVVGALLDLGVLVGGVVGELDGGTELLRYSLPINVFARSSRVIS